MAPQPLGPRAGRKRRRRAQHQPQRTRLHPTHHRHRSQQRRRSSNSSHFLSLCNSKSDANDEHTRTRASASGAEAVGTWVQRMETPSGERPTGLCIWLSLHPSKAHGESGTDCPTGKCCGRPTNAQRTRISAGLVHTCKRAEGGREGRVKRAAEHTNPEFSKNFRQISTLICAVAAADE